MFEDHPRRCHEGAFPRRLRPPSLLQLGKIYKYDIDLWFTSRVIPAGHRLHVVVASTAFPKYDRNLNTGGDNERDYAASRVRVRPAGTSFICAGGSLVAARWRALATKWHFGLKVLQAKLSMS